MKKETEIKVGYIAASIIFFAGFINILFANPDILAGIIFFTLEKKCLMMLEGLKK